MSWRLAKHRYGLVGTVCKSCKSLHFPPRVVCMGCGLDNQEPIKFSGNGKLLSYTVIHAAPDGFEKQVPYVIGLVQLEEGPVISSQIVGNTNDTSINKPVKVVFRRLTENGSAGVINYGFKFELVDN
ncbi:Zn-ribbon domain-containing OB-fold protein [archaeon]|nr:Zn-ribbon domain-containing OB-fold protein [archaeon]